jgi:hypothetical protein
VIYFLSGFLFSIVCNRWVLHFLIIVILDDFILDSALLDPACNGRSLNDEQTNEFEDLFSMIWRS